MRFFYVFENTPRPLEALGTETSNCLNSFKIERKKNILTSKLVRDERILRKENICTKYFEIVKILKSVWFFCYNVENVQDKLMLD